MVDLAVLVLWLDSISKIFSNLDDSMICFSFVLWWAACVKYAHVILKLVQEFIF